MIILCKKKKTPHRGKSTQTKLYRIFRNNTLVNQIQLNIKDIIAIIYMSKI